MVLACPACSDHVSMCISFLTQKDEAGQCEWAALNPASIPYTLDLNLAPTSRQLQDVPEAQKQVRVTSDKAQGIKGASHARDPLVGQRAGRGAVAKEARGARVHLRPTTAVKARTCVQPSGLMIRWLSCSI